MSWDHLVAEGDKKFPPALAPQLVTPRCDLPGNGERAQSQYFGKLTDKQQDRLPGQGKGAGLGAGEVHPLQLHHHLPHHVVPAVSVEGQHDKVEGENLVEEKMVSATFQIGQSGQW